MGQPWNPLSLDITLADCHRWRDMWLERGTRQWLHSFPSRNDPVHRVTFIDLRSGAWVEAQGTSYVRVLVTATGQAADKLAPEIDR
jgi:hypothetical protein